MPCSRLMLSSVLGTRDPQNARKLFEDLARRVTGRIQITSDGYMAYLPAVQETFNGDVDYSQIVKKRVDSNGVIHEMQTRPMIGNPNLNHARTSYVERLNLTLRTSNERMTRKTISFSRRFDHHVYQVALYFVYYNFCRRHRTLRTTPAVRAGLVDREYDWDWLIGLVEARDRQPGPRGPYRRRISQPQTPTGGPDDGGDDNAAVEAEQEPEPEPEVERISV